MLWGWDATESQAAASTTEMEDEETGETVQVNSYQFKAAAYRTFVNDHSELKEIKVSGPGDNRDNLFIKFGFKIWGEGSDVIK